jgi:hypothetical protein
MTTCLRNVLLIGMALALVGCAAGSRGRGKPEGLAFFGPDANKLEKGGEGDWMLSYRNPDANFPSYDSIILDPVSIWVDRDGNLSKVSAQDRQRLANNFYTLAHRSISRYLKVVAEPGERTLRLKIALTNAGASSRTLDTVSSVVPQLRATTTLDRRERRDGCGQAGGKQDDGRFDGLLERRQQRPRLLGRPRRISDLRGDAPRELPEAQRQA